VSLTTGSFKFQLGVSESRQIFFCPSPRCSRSGTGESRYGNGFVQEASNLVNESVKPDPVGIFRPTRLVIAFSYPVNFEKTFRIPCAWRSTLSDTIDREIYHQKSETIAGNNYHSLRPPLNSELKLTNKVKKGEFLSKCGQCLIFVFSPTEWLSVGWFFKPKIHGKSQNCREILENTKRVKVS